MSKHFNYTTDHFLFQEGRLFAFERSWKLVITDSRGIPKRRIPDGVGWQQRQRMLLPGERVTNAWVLNPINIRDYE